MAVKQGTVQLQMHVVFATIMVFFLAHGTMLVASNKSKQTNEKAEAKQTDRKAEFDAWYRSLSDAQKPHDMFYLYTKSCLDGIDDKNCVKQVFDSLVVGTSMKKGEVGCGCKVKELGRLCLIAVGGTTGHMKKYEADADRIIKRAHQMFLKSHKLECPAK